MDDADAVLVRRVGRGDAVAFAELYDRSAPWVLARLRRRCRDDSLAEEVLQDTFLTVWRAAGGYRGTGSAAGWIWVVARNRLVEVARRETAAGRLLDEPAAVSSAEQAALHDRFSGPLEQALDQLSPELRAVLQATVLDGFSTREAALLLGIPEGTVKNRAFRARRILREAMS